MVNDLDPSRRDQIIQVTGREAGSTEISDVETDPPQFSPDRFLPISVGTPQYMHLTFNVFELFARELCFSLHGSTSLTARLLRLLRLPLLHRGP